MEHSTKTTRGELQKMNRLALLWNIPKGWVIVEVWVWRWAFSRQILRICQPNKLYLIDPWMWHAQWHCNDQRNQKKWMQHPDDIYNSVVSAFEDDDRVVIIRSWSLDVVGEFEDGSIDAVYVDGDHRYEQAREDIHAWFPKLKNDGFLCGDDMNYMQLPESLSQKEVDVNGVPRAVIEFLWELQDPKNYGLSIDMFRLYGNNWMIQKNQAITQAW